MTGGSTATGAEQRARKRPPRKRRPRKRRPREPLTWARFWRGLTGYLRSTWPRWCSIIGGFTVLLALLHLPGDASTLRQNTDLQQRGRTVPAVVVDVEVRHHTGYRGGSWTEYWPLTRQTVDGDTFTASLRRYATSDPDRYARGQHLDVLSDPAHPWTVALAGDAARTSLQRRVQGEGITGAVGLAFLAVGVPVELRARRRKRRRTATARPLGTARRRTR